MAGFTLAKFLVHRGVLSLDEIPEFGSKNLETLRQPLEDKVVTISRASGMLTFPVGFIFMAAMNPCPYGLFISGIRDIMATRDWEIRREFTVRAVSHLLRRRNWDR